MKQYVIKYTVVIQAENENIAELLSIDLEGDICNVHRRIQNVYADPYVEEVIPLSDNTDTPNGNDE